MKVFISWSGDTSRAVATALAEWLPDVLQAVEPWMSSEDIPKGSQWLQEVTKQLEENSRGVVVVTPDNHERPWLNFEAGALSAKATQARVCTALFQVTNANVSGPLGVFQSTDLSSAEDIGRLVATLNSDLGSKALDKSRLDRALTRSIPDLIARLEEIPTHALQGVPSAEPARTDRALLEELLELVRGESRRDAVQESDLSAELLPNGEPLSIGAQVQHEVFGRGLVMAIEGSGKQQIVHVDFEGIGLKHLIPRFTPMEIVRR